MRGRWLSSKRLIEPFDWSLKGPARGLRGDIQELVLFPILRSFAKLSIEGKDNFDRVDGPVLIYANHSSHFDAPVVLASLPHRIRHRTIIAAAADYFYKVQAVGALASLALGTIPFSRHEDSKVSIDRCKDALRMGWSVLIFPEGTRSKDGMLGEFKKGAAYMCVDALTPALPIYLEGAYEIFPKGASMPRPGKVKVKVGQPVSPRPGDDYDTFTARMRDALIDLGARTKDTED